MLSALLRRLARTSPRNLAVDSVETTTRFAEAPEQVWQCLMFFEDVPHPPTRLIRWLLPSPMMTCGEMMRTGALVPAMYDGGYLERRITRVEPGRSLRFSVVTQELGVEDCVTILGGSQRVRAHGTGSELTLTTRYHGHVQPRWLARALEQLVARQVHAHVIEGMTRKLDTLPGRTASIDRGAPSWQVIAREGHAESRASGLRIATAS